MAAAATSASRHLKDGLNITWNAFVGKVETHTAFLKSSLRTFAMSVVAKCKKEATTLLGKKPVEPYVKEILKMNDSKEQFELMHALPDREENKELFKFHGSIVTTIKFVSGVADIIKAR